MQLSGPGQLLINTDLHGNLADFERLREVFEGLCAAHDVVHWVVLGDAVHGPNEATRHRWNGRLYDYADGSFEIVRGIRALQRAHPGRVHYVLGNHDHAHIGGPRTAKFYGDEAGHLESQLTPEQILELRALFHHAHLAIATSCGALLCHAAPDDTLERFSDLPERLPPPRDDAYQNALIRAFTTAYGRPQEVMERLLQTVSRDTGFEMTFVVQGHDRDLDGFYSEHPRVAMPCLFGAPDENKRYLLLDLAVHYEDARALREGFEIRRLYPEKESPGPLPDYP